MTYNEELAKTIHDTIEAMPHARRLYPDLYAEEVAEAVVAWQESERKNRNLFRRFWKWVQAGIPVKGGRTTRLGE